MAAAGGGLVLRHYSIILIVRTADGWQRVIRVPKITSYPHSLIPSSQSDPDMEDGGTCINIYITFWCRAASGRSGFAQILYRGGHAANTYRISQYLVHYLIVGTHTP